MRFTITRPSPTVINLCPSSRSRLAATYQAMVSSTRQPGRTKARPYDRMAFYACIMLKISSVGSRLAATYQAIVSSSRHPGLNGARPYDHAYPVAPIRDHDRTSNDSPGHNEASRPRLGRLAMY